MDKYFESVKDAFDWWIKNEYPSLEPDVKKGKLVQAWRDYTYSQGISEKRMSDILNEFSSLEVITIIRRKK